MNQYKKTILKAEAVVKNRIEKIDERIAVINEKYPYELFGGKADAMCIDLEAEKKELIDWLKPDVKLDRALREITDLRTAVRESRWALERAHTVLHECHEYREAERIETVLKKLPMVY